MVYNWLIVKIVCEWVVEGPSRLHNVRYLLGKQLLKVNINLDIWILHEPIQIKINMFNL